MDELIPGLLLRAQIFDQWHIWLAEFWPVAIAKGSIKVHGDCPDINPDDLLGNALTDMVFEKVVEG